MAKPLPVYESTVQPDWIDYNGHMRDAYFAVAFSTATDNFMDHLGLDAGYRAATKQTLYTLEMQLRFLQEISDGRPFTITAQLLGADAKRMHLFLRLHAQETGALVATQECMLLHVDQSAGPASAPFPETIAARIEDLLREHKALPVPEAASRPISMARKKARKNG